MSAPFAEDWDDYAAALDIIETMVGDADIAELARTARRRAGEARAAGSTRATNDMRPRPEGDPSKDVRQETRPAPAEAPGTSLGIDDPQLGAQAPQR